SEPPVTTGGASPAPVCALKMATHQRPAIAPVGSRCELDTVQAGPYNPSHGLSVPLPRQPSGSAARSRDQSDTPADRHPPCALFSCGALVGGPGAGDCQPTSPRNLAGDRIQHTQLVRTEDAHPRGHRRPEPGFLRPEYLGPLSYV